MISFGRIVGMTTAWALFWTLSGHAQEQNGKTARLLKLYADCVLDGVTSQIKRGIDNGSAATELAFQECRTEEQAIMLHARAGGVSVTQAEQSVSDLKLALKQDIRKAFASPEKYAPKQQPARQAAPLPQPHPPGCGFRRYDGAWVSLDCY